MFYGNFRLQDGYNGILPSQGLPEVGRESLLIHIEIQGILLDIR